MLKMVLVCSGNSCVVAQDGRQAPLSAAEFAIYDTRRPYEVACGVGGERPTQMMTFMFPPSLLPLSRNRLGQLAAVRFPTGAGLGDLTSQFLLQLARDIDHYSPAEAARLSSAALEVLATRLAHELDIRGWGTPEARRHAQVTTVQAFIQRRASAVVDRRWRSHHDYDNCDLAGGGAMILINIKMQIRPEKMSEWLALADFYAKDVNSEDGCLFFQFARSLTDENEFVCIEGFKDAVAGATHVKQPYVKKFFDTAPDLVATQPQIIYIDAPHDGFGPMGEIQPR